MHVKGPLDIFLSHDWPLGITEYGDWQKLIRGKKHFEEEVTLTTLRDCLMLKLNAVALFFPL
jgi:lariat debranching enzyme